MPRWSASVLIAAGAGALACNAVLDIPGDPYLVEAPPPVPSQLPMEGPGNPAQPTPPTTPEVELDDVQGGSAANGSSSEPADPGTPSGTAPPDAGAPPLDAASPDAGAACPAGGAVGPSGRCYIAVATTQTWPEAESGCNALGPGWGLAAIHDAATNTFLGTLIDVEAWIGASDAESEGAWRWVIDGVPFWSGDGETGVPVNGAFEVWAGGEPNGEEGSNCARLVPDPPRWADLECDSLRAALCEGPPL